METLKEFITEAINPAGIAKADKLSNRPYGAYGFIEGKGFTGGVILGQPFAMDDTNGQQQAASMAETYFKIKVNFDDLISAIEKNKKGAYDEVVKKDKYKNMMYVYFAPNKSDEVYCSLYSDTNVYLKGNYAYALK